jgi:hypothetical protein
LIQPGTWRICKEASCTHSRMAFSLISMCQICFVVKLWDHRTQDSLLLYRGEALVVSKILWPLSLALSARLQILINNLETSLVAQISASHELSEVRFWRTTIQAIGPPCRKMMPPLMLRCLKSGRRVPSRTAEPVWEP